MLIGLSIDQCVLDIAMDKVHVDDVLVIISKEDFNVEDSMTFEKLWLRNTTPNLFGTPLWKDLSREPTFNILDELYFDGKIHCQPQWAMSTHARRMVPYAWMEVIVPPDEDNVAARQAYLDYKLISDLSFEQKTNKD